MPTKSDNGPSVSVQKSVDGERYELGASFGDVFVPFAAVQAQHVEGLTAEHKANSDGE